MPNSRFLTAERFRTTAEIIARALPGGAPLPDPATEIANLRDDCTAAHEMIEVQRTRIAQLEDDVRAESEYAARYAIDLHRAELRAQTYRCRAMALLHRTDEERIWASFYQSEVARLQTELNTLRGKIEAQRVVINAKNEAWNGGDVVMTLSAVEEMLGELLATASGEEVQP